MDNFKKLKDAFVKACEEISRVSKENGLNIQFETSEDPDEKNRTKLTLAKLSIETTPKILEEMTIGFNDKAGTIVHPRDHHNVKVCDSNGMFMEDIKSLVHTFVKEASRISGLPEDQIMTLLDNLTIDRRAGLFLDTL